MSLRRFSRALMICTAVVAAHGGEVLALDWQTEVSMPTCRTQFDAATATDGAGVTRIYVIGGRPDGGGAPYSSVEAYDPATHSWIPRASLPQARWGLAAVTGVDGQIYVFGGFDSNDVTTATVMVYDPVADHWVTKPNAMPTTRGLLTAAVFPPTGVIYVFEGVIPPGTGVVEGYDPGSDTWTTADPLQDGYALLQTSAVYARCLNKILVLGGSGNAVDENGIFDPTAGPGAQWTLGPPPDPEPRFAPTSIEGPDGSIFTIGGYVVGGAPYTPTNLVRRYLPLDNTWQTADAMPTARSRPALATLGDRVYVLGGEKESTSSDVCHTVESYGAFGAGPECCRPPALNEISNLSNRGFDFWLVDPASEEDVYGFAIVISNTMSCGPAAVSIFNVQGGTMSVSVPAGEVQSITFPGRSVTSAGDTITPNAVYHVTSDKPIAVFTLKPPDAIAENNDAGLVLPVTSLGTDYRVATYVIPVNSAGMFFEVIATQPGNTHVDVFDAQGNSQKSVDIPQGSCFQSKNGTISPPVTDDMTGWRIVSDKPVSAFSGDECTAVLTPHTCDQIYESLLPVSGAVTTYAVCPSRTRPLGCGPVCAVDLFRFVGLSNGTTITTSPSVASGVINAGDYMEIVTDEPFVLNASAPVVGFQYLTSHTPGYGTNPAPGIGDPSLLDVLPVEQFQSDYLVLSPDEGWYHQFLNVIAPLGTNLELDGAPVSWPCDLAGTVNGVPYCCESGEVQTGAHHLTGDRQFGLSVSGFVDQGSYAYTAGAMLPATFCIKGSSSGQSYTWWLDLLDDDQNAGSEPYEMDAPGVLPVGAPAEALASSLADRININSVSISKGIHAVATGACLQVLGADQFSLRVGHGSATSCRVTSQGCTYNPTIYLRHSPSAAGPSGGGSGGRGHHPPKVMQQTGGPGQVAYTQAVAAPPANEARPTAPRFSPPPSGMTRWSLLHAIRASKRYGGPIQASLLQGHDEARVIVRTWSGSMTQDIFVDARTGHVKRVDAVEDRSGEARAAALALPSTRSLENAIIETAHAHRGWIPVEVELDRSGSVPKARVRLARGDEELTFTVELGGV